MTEALEIVAIAAKTPVGRTAERSAVAVRAGISRCREYPFAGLSGAPLVTAADPDLDPACEGPARLEHLLLGALVQATEALACGGPHPGAHHVLLALPEARPGFLARDAAGLVDTVRARLRRSYAHIEVQVAGEGHAGAVQAIELAQQIVAATPDALCWIVGVDSYLDPATLLWLERDRRSAQPGVRGGFIPGEGAGCLIVATPALRRRLRLPQLATIRGARTVRETQLRTSALGSLGHGMSAAVEAAAAQLHLPDEAVDALYTDLNGERYRSEEWGFVAMRTAAVWRTLQYTAPADLWGDTGAAFVPLAAVLAVRSFARNYARGPRVMVTAGSDGGLRGAVLLQRSADAPVR